MGAAVVRPLDEKTSLSQFTHVAVVVAVVIFTVVIIAAG